MNTKNINPVTYFLVTFFGGYLGIHKFIDGKIGMGILYIFTVGLFGIGWIVDTIKALIAMINPPAARSNVSYNENINTSHIPNKKVIVGEMSRVTFGDYISESGGYCNYAKYDVIAVNPKTNRKNKVRVEAKDKSQAIEIAKKEKELIEPFEVKVVPFSTPTERQIEYALNIGMIIPDDVNIEDIGAMLTRFENESTGASQELANYAEAVGVNFSAYIGYKELISCIASVSNRERCALFAYAINQSLKKAPIENMKTDLKCSVFYAFADYALSNEKILKSIKSREIEDYINPYKGTIAYKEALAFILNH